MSCQHLSHLPSGKCLGCGEQHQPLPSYQPGDDDAYLAAEAKANARVTGDDVIERLKRIIEGDDSVPIFATIEDAIAALSASPLMGSEK
jgi:hypothetical protein